MEFFVYNILWNIIIFVGSIVLTLACFVIGLRTLFQKPVRSNAYRYYKIGLSVFLIGVGGITLFQSGSRILPFFFSANQAPLPSLSQIVSPAPQYYDATDPAIRPFIEAINTRDRAALGFTPIAPHSRISIHRTVGSEATYDVQMNVFGSPARYIAFKQQGNTYIWLAEQEIHTGPQIYQSGDGQSHETISITYETVYYSGAPLNRTSIYYAGRDPRLFEKSRLTLQDISPILQEWEAILPTATATRP
jgi:hypothetical protein